MRKRSLWLASLAVAGCAATFSMPASAGDPVAGMLIGGGIGAAIGGPPGAAIGAVIGSIAATSDPYYDRHYYGRGYYGPSAGYYAPPRVAYYDAPYYAPRRVYAEPYYAPRVEYRRYDERRYRDDRRYYRDDRRDERHYQRGEFDRRDYR
jgi:hypothetical protein